MEEEKSTWEVENSMIAANCSTIRNILAIKENYVFYGITNTVCVYNHAQNKVVCCLNGHTGRVNGVHLVEAEKGLTALCTVDTDKTMILWIAEDVEANKWTKTVYKDAHDAEINFVTGTRLGERVYIATFCLGGTLKIWKSATEEISSGLGLLCQLHFGSNLQETFKMFALNQKYIMLLTGGFDKKVHVYSINTKRDGDEAIEYHDSLTGHANSIRDFCVTDKYESDLRYIFSCSQDCLIRVWKICKISDDEAAEELKKQELEEYSVEHLKTKTSYILRFGDQSVYNITLSSVLQHHSSSVTTVRILEDKISDEPDLLNRLTLLSSSFDFTVCLWKVDKTSGVWAVETTLGEMSGNKHAFFGAEFLSSDSIFAYTYNGAFHRWDHEDDIWYNKPCVTGHWDEVPDIDWDTHRDYLVSTSKDQTTRIYTFCKNLERWSEISRPQVHGYDINCISFLKSKDSASNDSMKFSDHIVSGADEKIVRIFDAPFSFVKSANKYNEDNLRYSSEMTNQEVENAIMGKKSEVASMTLGLMNKPVMPKKNLRVDEQKEGGTTVDDFEPDVLTNTKTMADEIVEETGHDVMLTEEYLMTKTRWPERNKLYGHAYELYCIATSKKGDVIVTSAKSKKKKYSNIFVWTIDSLNPIGQLEAHEFTVHQMEFSKDDKYLLCVSRDRQFSVFERDEDQVFKLVQLQKQAHKRILWCCSWAHDSKYFATGSREKTNSLKFWNFDEESKQWSEHSSIAKNLVNVTSVAFFPGPVNGGKDYGVVVGLDSGEISIWTKPMDTKETEWTQVYALPEYYRHSQTVRRIKFKETEANEKGEYHIATCSNDATTRIFKIKCESA